MNETNTTYLLPARATGRVFSFGGGVQSTAVLVLAAQGKLRYDAFVFANVGNDSENPETLRYLHEYARPFAEEHHISMVGVQKTYKKKPDTIKQAIYRENRSIPIPAYMSGGAPGNRSCTTDFKILVVDKWIKQQRLERCVVGLGISLDEFHRAKDERWHNKHGKKKIGFWKRREHPLIDMRLNREDCKRIITSAGLPIPPKSSCFFCPFLKPSEWVTMRRDEPALFQEAIGIQNQVNTKRSSLGKDRLYLHSKLILLENIGVQPLLFSDEEMDDCAEGVCFT